MTIRVLTVISIIVLIPLGLATKLYSGAGALWVHDSLGGVMYEICLCLIVFLLLPSANVVGIATAVFFATGVLEVFQLWHPPFLENVRATFIGCIVLGTSFAWSDFVYYAAGCILGWIWMKWLKMRG